VKTCGHPMRLPGPMPSGPENREPRRRSGPRAREAPEPSGASFGKPRAPRKTVCRNGAAPTPQDAIPGRNPSRGRLAGGSPGPEAVSGPAPSPSLAGASAPAAAIQARAASSPQSRFPCRVRTAGLPGTAKRRPTSRPGGAPSARYRVAPPVPERHRPALPRPPRRLPSRRAPPAGCPAGPRPPKKTKAPRTPSFRRIRKPRSAASGLRGARRPRPAPPAHRRAPPRVRRAC
jgi:hypothetical protein